MPKVVISNKVIISNIGNIIMVSNLSNSKFLKLLSRIDCKTLYGLITILYTGGAMKKSQIVGKSKLNYTSFRSYLFWLESMDLIEIITDRNDDELVKLTEHGIHFHSKLQENL